MRARSLQVLFSWVLSGALSVTLVACGGGSSDAAAPVADTPNVLAEAPVEPQSATTLPQVTTSQQGADASPPVPAPLLQGVLSATVATGAINSGKADPGLLLLLVPDGQSLDDPRVTAWNDAASEIGGRLLAISDTQLLATGAAGLRGFAGLVLPDQLHTVASDAVVAAVRGYTEGGGRTFLTFDFAALTLNANGIPVYPIPKSRLSDMAGVDYVLYDALLDRTVGLGPVTALRSTMRELLVPPGKSMPYFGAASANALIQKSAQPQADAALYLPVSVADPGGVRGFDPQQFQTLPQSPLRDRLGGPGNVPPRKVHLDLGTAIKSPAVPWVTRAAPAATAAPEEPVPDGAQAIRKASALAPTATDPLDVYHGYLLGNLVYPSYVTTGEYDGKALAVSPQFGLVAGIRTFGSGRVMFVNLPLVYLKGRTDALPMHGFLHYFMNKVVTGARLSAMPNAVPGLTFDWHLDSMSAQTPTLALEAAGVFQSAAKFSMEMTAGPDTIAIGDGRGWNLNGNPDAQQIIRRLDQRGHAWGSHGGWIHDYYGLNATEDNESTFLQYLELNAAAVDGAVGRPARSYSAPEGNNPRWAMRWLAQRGVVGAYFGGHTGLGATRQYRDGVLLDPTMWVFPVTPQGLYATFEEWQAYAVPKPEVIAWYRGLADFAVAQNTSRLVYAHPPGARDWLDVLQNLLAYTNGKGTSKFVWYTMPRLADFMATRGRVDWTQSLLANGNTRFAASHPVTLQEMAWMLPKARYLRPTLRSGSATVTDGGGYWLVKGLAGPALSFDAKPNLTYVPA
jgi:hypothetical protein